MASRDNQRLIEAAFMSTLHMFMSVDKGHSLRDVSVLQVVQYMLYLLGESDDTESGEGQDEDENAREDMENEAAVEKKAMLYPSSFHARTGVHLAAKVEADIAHRDVRELLKVFSWLQVPEKDVVGIKSLQWTCGRLLDLAKTTEGKKAKFLKDKASKGYVSKLKKEMSGLDKREQLTIQYITS